jgi:hypothetical protein
MSNTKATTAKRRVVQSRAWMEVYGMLQSHIDSDSDFGVDRDDEELHEAVRKAIQKIANDAAERSRRYHNLK